jgi:hypothetical protein
MQFDTIGEQWRAMEQSSKMARRAAQIDDLKLKEIALEEKLTSLANGSLLQQLETLKLQNQELTAEIERKQSENRRLWSEINRSPPSSPEDPRLNREQGAHQRQVHQRNSPLLPQSLIPFPPSFQPRRGVTQSSPTLVPDYGQQGPQRSPVQSTGQRGNRPSR